MDERKATKDLKTDAQSALERRFYAAMIDMVAVSAGCFAVAQARSALLPEGMPAIRRPAMVLLSIILFFEAITGRSVGKVAMGLRIKRVEKREETGKVTLPQTIVRAAARWFAPLLALASLMTKDMSMAGLLIATAMMLVICEVPACYITLFRRGGTVFDLIARTRVN